MKLFHKTSPAAAAAIVRDGFRDGVALAGEPTGVWFADAGFDYPTGGEGAVIRIECPEAVARRYEEPVRQDVWVNGAWRDTQERAFRAFCLPADVANQFPRVLDMEETGAVL